MMDEMPPSVVAAYLARLEDALSYEYAMFAHEMIWGVPVGPTRSMAEPPDKRSILELL